MRRGLRKTRQVMAGLSAVVLLMTSLPLNATYVYAAEQVEDQQPQAEEMTHTQNESELETKETEKESDREETKETEEKSDQEETKEEKTDAPDGDVGETNIEGETEKPEESTETEESIEFESEEEEQETGSADQTSSKEQIVTAKLTGAYQFGDAPSKRGKVSVFSVDLAADTDIKELQDYLYQQMKERKEYIDIKKYGISIDEADKVISIVSGVLNENPDLYFVGKSINWGYSGDTVIAIIPSYAGSYDDTAFRKAAEEALAVVKPGMSNLEKAIVLHDYLAVNCEYDEENLEQEEAGTGKVPDASYTAYGTLVNRISVCEGYALAYKYLLNQSGIDCLMVKSDTMNHAWNLIRLDGKYYQVDVTWDDPTWDRIGRVRHEYMFRSDDAFRSKCSREHNDWIVTEGGEVVNYEATDTSYDNAFWLDCDSPLALVGEDCYYVTYNGTTGVINKTKLSDTAGEGTAVCDIGTWADWDGSGYWKRAYSGLFYMKDRLYYNDSLSIRSFAFDDAGDVIDKREEFKADTTDGYIYGSAFCQGKVLYSLHKSPNETGKETVLTAAITIETGEPSGTPVEKIELDQETLVLAVGGTATLHAVVTPDDADAVIKWASSDNTVATVSDGTVTAAAAGSCTITASADGEAAACKVTVTDREEGTIASGSYENITWKIDADGKLTVEGTGEFADSSGRDDRAPWYASRGSITSANIHVTDMEDASAMFSGCENLTSVDLSGFDTSKVTNMKCMFAGCRSLTTIDVSRFKTENVTNMERMFEYCSNMESVNLSNFDMGKVEDGTRLLYGCSKLTTIYTPRNLSQANPLPSAGWYTTDGKEITELPQNLGYTIMISKFAPHVIVQKIKTVYECGDVVNTDDLTVIYYDKDGTAKTVTDYTTNANAINMSYRGTKTLTVNYQGLEASVDLTVTAPAKTDKDQEAYTVTFNLQGHGITLEEYSTYTEIRKGSTIKRPASPEAWGYEFTGWYKEADCQTLWDFEKDTVEENITLYAGWKSSEEVGEKPNDKPNEKPVINSVLFPGKKSEYSAVYTGGQIRPAMVVACQYTDARGKTKAEKLKLNVDYTVRYSNNVNAGGKTARVTVRGIGGYTGTITSEFTITPKSIKNVTLSAVGDIVFGEQPSVRVTDGTNELVEGRDYHIILSTQGSADTDTQSVLTVEGTGNYTGTSKKSMKFNILKNGTDVLPVASENIRVEFKNPAKRYTYNGKAQKPGVIVTDTETGKKIPSSMYKVIYSNNINAGKGSAEAWVVGVSKNGKGYYGVSGPMYFDIDQKDFKNVSASLSGTIPKTGSIEDIRKSIDEAIVVKDAKYVLSGDEYTIDYGEIRAVDDIKIGKQYPVTLTAGKGGNYLENSKKTVKIKFGQLNLASRTAKRSVIVTNASQNEISFRYNGMLLEKNKDYTATVKKEKNKDTYTVKIKAVKNSAYKGNITFINVESGQDTAGNDPVTPGDPGSDPIIPEDPGSKPVASDNNLYRRYNQIKGDTVKSYLYENQSGGLTRVEYIDGEIVAEDYDESFHLRASRRIPMELPIWGGFYAGDKYNFVFFGQNNPSEDKKTEVIRVVKYSKDWERLGADGLYGANTTVPFRAGSLRCAEYGDYLYIRTCHQMFKSADGRNHQANMTFLIRQSEMEITDFFDIGYVSHSFNQFVLVDQDQNLVTLDHGDAYPRGIVLMRPLASKAGGDNLNPRIEESNVVEFSGAHGENYTGASVGGFAETNNGYVTAFNDENYDGINWGNPRAVYLGFTSKSDLSSKVTQVTGYDGVLTPVLVPTGLDGGYLMWTDEEGNFYYTRYADGGTTGTVSTADALLSDCQPILHNGACVWYVTKQSVPTFYKLDVSSSEISKITAK